MHTNSAQIRYTSPPCLESESGRWGLFSVVFLLCELVLAHSGAFLPSGPYDPSEHSVPLHAEAPAGHPNAHVSPTIAHIACQASSPPDHSISRGSGWASSFPAHAPKKLKGETTQDWPTPRVPTRASAPQQHHHTDHMTNLRLTCALSCARTQTDKPVELKYVPEPQSKQALAPTERDSAGQTLARSLRPVGQPPDSQPWAYTRPSRSEGPGITGAASLWESGGLVPSMAVPAGE